ncbi:MAG TPA: VanZ family protein [Flavitalea sp.]|nr:VanZ family protein [Flavitalea sp.]
MRLIRKLTRTKFLPVCWTLLTIVLLCLPGSALPGGGLFNIPQLDKVAHLILFGGIALLWIYQFRHQGKATFPKMLMTVVALTILLGIIMEFVQLNYIPNRSFDVGDIIADAAGAIIIGIFCRKEIDVAA